MKQLFRFSLLLLGLLLPATIFAHDFYVDGIYYNKNGTQATVTYRGTAYSQYSNEYSGSVIIPSSVTYKGTTYSVTSIGDHAFHGCSGLTSVSIPNSVTEIEVCAFFECNNLDSIEIPNSVTTIGTYAFEWCSGLTSVTIPNSVTSIGAYAFAHCFDLTSVTIPNSVTKIGTSEFLNCTSLTSVTIPNSVTSIGLSAFGGCSSLANITIPNSVTSIGEGAFSGTAWYNNQPDGLVYAGHIAYKYKGTMQSETSITIREGTLGIADKAFLDCTSLTSVTIPNSVKSIGNSAFYGCSSLTGITIPNSVKSIGDLALYRCSGLAVITVESDNNIFDSRNNCNAIIYTATNTLIAGCKATVIPNSVTSIGDYAFTFCLGLTSVTIPNSVTSIGDYAFSVCLGLTSVTIPNSVTSIGDYAFKDCSGLNDVYSCIVSPVSISMGSNVFYLYEGNYAERTLHVPDGSLIAYEAARKWSNYFGSIVRFEFITFADANVKALCIQNWDANGDGELSITEAASVTDLGTVFKYNSTITSFDELQFFTGLTSIDDDAFYSCSGLTSITIPNSVTSIGNWAFSYCSGLTSIDIPNSVISISERAFYRCSGLTSITIPNSVTSIGNYAFSGCSGLTSITIPNSVTSVGGYAFSGCSGLMSVTIPNFLDSISEGMLAGCSGLTYITIPNSVTSVGGYAFSGCSGLMSVTIPNSVTSIGDGAFYECSGLTSITIPNSVTSIGNCVFEDCTSLTSVTIPNSVTSIGDYAFSYCSGLTSVTIPNSVISIGESAFEGCSSLINVNIPNSVISIGDEAFGDCSSLTNMIIPSSVTSIGRWAFGNCSGLDDVYTLIVNPYSIEMGSDVFELEPGNYAGRTLHVPAGSVALYQGYSKWSQYFDNIVEISNYLTMADLSVCHGKTIVIPVAMFNSESIISFQTDIFLSEGLEIARDDGDYLIDPSDRMTRTHSLMCNEVSSGAIRVMCYSSIYKPFTGNSGDDLFYITVKVADNAEGNYFIQLKNTLLTNTDFVDIIVPDVVATIKVKAFIPGDANNSGAVTITDVVVTAQYVMEMNPYPFNFEAADVNEDNNITVADVSRIAWMVLNPTLNAPRRAPALWNNGDRMSGEGITLMAGETRTVSIALDNTMDYSAFQFDLTLPEGLSASNFRLTDRAGNHTLDVNTLANGKTRALCYSPSLATINGHDGTLLTFDVTATSVIADNIFVDDIEFVTTDCQSVKLDAFPISVNSSTSVTELSNTKVVARVDYYNLAGQRIERPEGGVTLIVTTYTDGTRTTTKVIK